MRRDFRAWLEQQGYMPNTVASRCSELQRVQYYFGDVDQRFAADRFETLLACLEYSTEDERRCRANPSRFPIYGDLRTNLATYKTAIVLYRRFKDDLDGLTTPRRRRYASSPRVAPSSFPKRPFWFSIGARIQFWFGAHG